MASNAPKGQSTNRHQTPAIGCEFEGKEWEMGVFGTRSNEWCFFGKKGDGFRAAVN